MTKSLYKLKWLNNVLIGRELELPFGEIRLGGENPDIALPLEIDAEAILVVSEEGITASPNIPIWVNGYPWREEKPLPQNSVIDLAGLIFVFGNIEQSLPTLPIPIRKNNKGKTSKFEKIVVLSALALLTLLILITINTSQEYEEPFDKVTWLEQEMKQPELIGLQARIDDNDIIHLNGISSDPNIIPRLQEKFTQLGFSFYNQSIDVQTLHSVVRQILEINGYHDIEVVTGDSLDTVKIYGDIQLNYNWQQTQVQLRKISALQSWSVINNREDEFRRLLQYLDSKFLLDGLNISIKNNELLVSGQPPIDNSSDLKDIIEKFNNSNYTRMKANYQNIPNKIMATEILPAIIVSVGGNDELTYLQLSNNMRLYEGSILPSGYKVYSLNRHTLMLIKNQNFISISINL